MHTNFDAQFFICPKKIQHYASIEDLEWESDQTPTPSPNTRRRSQWKWQDYYVIRGGRVFRKDTEANALRMGTHILLVH